MGYIEGDLTVHVHGAAPLERHREAAAPNSRGAMVTSLRGTTWTSSGLFQVLHLNFEYEAKCLSCLDILVLLRREPHSEPHSCKLQCDA